MCVLRDEPYVNKWWVAFSDFFFNLYSSRGSRNACEAVLLPFIQTGRRRSRVNIIGEVTSTDFREEEESSKTDAEQRL